MMNLEKLGGARLMLPSSNRKGTGRLQSHFVSFSWSSCQLRFHRILVVSLSVWLTMSVPLFASVDLRTNIRDASYRSPSAELGAITMSVNGNDFPQASAENPVYVRVKLLGGAKLTQTLVNIDGPVSSHLPIFLAMRIEGSQDQGITLLAAPETISIVRWISDESEIWLCIRSSSSQWVQVMDDVQPPSILSRVAWTFGITGRQAYERYTLTGDYAAGRTNLGANIRPNSLFTIERETVSTLTAVDLRESAIAPMPFINSNVGFDLAYFVGSSHVTTAEDPLDIELGDQYVPLGSGDQTIGRGLSYDCTYSTVTSSENEAGLCAGTGLASLPVRLTLDQVACPNYPRMRLRIRVPAGARYGLLAGLLQRGEPSVDLINWWGNDPTDTVRQDYHQLGTIDVAPDVSETVWGEVEGAFSVNDGRDTLVTCFAIEFTPTSEPMTLDFALVMETHEIPTDVVLDVQLKAMREQWLDIEPHEGTQMRAPPIPEQKDQWFLNAGAFVACSGSTP